MANRYTNIPSSGGGGPTGCLLKWDLGGGVFFRLGCLGTCGAGWSVNYDAPSDTLDDPTQSGYMEQFDSRQDRCNGLIVTPDGVKQIWNRGGTLYSRNLQVLMGGDLIEDTVDTISLREGTLGQNSQASLIVRFRGYVLTVVGGGYIVKAEIGTDVVPLLTIPASTGAAFEIELHIGYDYNTGNPRYAARGFYDGANPQLTAVDGTFDPTAAQTLEITVQASDVADQMFCNSCVLVQENTDFCPGLS